MGLFRRESYEGPKKGERISLDLNANQLYSAETFSRSPQIVWNMILTLRRGEALPPVFVRGVRGHEGVFRLDGRQLNPRIEDHERDGGNHRSIAHLIEGIELPAIVSGKPLKIHPASPGFPEVAMPIEVMGIKTDAELRASDSSGFLIKNAYAGGIYSVEPNPDELAYMRGRLEEIRVGWLAVNGQ